MFNNGITQVGLAAAPAPKRSRIKLMYEDSSDEEEEKVKKEEKSKPTEENGVDKKKVTEAERLALKSIIHFSKL